MRQPEPPLHRAQTQVTPLPVPRAASARDEQLWESVLRETVSMCKADEPLTEQERQAFLKVAKEFSQRPFCLEPVLVGLVAAVLETQFGERIRSMAEWPEMIRAVADSLFEDPQMNQRLNSFWTKLVEEIGRDRS